MLLSVLQSLVVENKKKKQVFYHFAKLSSPFFSLIPLLLED